MSASAGTITVALVGNPNTGKSTLFRALVGVRQRVGNYPGVTVEKRIGHTEVGGHLLAVIDLPGTYSLAPRSPDEMITVDVLLGRLDDVPGPDVVVCIVDASNLQRNLYLVNQILEMGRPTVVALNMVDLAAGKGLGLNVGRLRARLGVPVIETQAHRKVGLTELRNAVGAAVGTVRPPFESPFPEPFCREVGLLHAAIGGNSGAKLPRFLVERLLLDTGNYLVQGGLPGVDAGIRSQIVVARERLAAAGLAVPAVETMARYRWVDQVLDGVVTHAACRPVTVTDRIDRFLTHKVLGTSAFGVVLVLVFQSIFTWSPLAMDGIEGIMGWLSDVVGANLPAGAFRSLITGGVIAGVGSVLVFLPQIMVLFLLVAVLEDCGYMARAAYLMDKMMSRIGLSGRSFIPLLSSFACAVPGIMAARCIEDRRDRLVTILVAPLMSCSARLPVYTLLIAAFIPEIRILGGWLSLQGLVMLGLYLVGVLTAVVVAWILNRTILRRQTPAFVLELPDYRIPSLDNILFRVLDGAWAFVRQAGTLIFAVAVLIWAAAYFPHRAEVEREIRGQYRRQIGELQAAIDQLDGPAAAGSARTQRRADPRQQLAVVEREIANRVAGAYIAQSVLGRLGRLIEPAVKPLGWDWRIGCAVIASLPAREAVIGTLGVIYNAGEQQDEKSTRLRARLRSATWPGTDRAVFSIPVALSVMVFFALCAQCMATLVVIGQETSSWCWPVFTFAYMTTLAYLGALTTYQVGIRLVS